MKTLEEELDSLKKGAYDNVSEKLKVFEDEFFVDLKARGESVEARLVAWRADMDKTLSDLAASAAADRAAAERASVEEMRARLAEAQSRLQEQLDKMRDRAQATQDGIVAQGGMAAESLAALKESVLRDAADARSTAQAYVEGEISRFTLEASGRLKATERDFAARLEALSAGIGSEEESLRHAREAASEAAESFRSRFAEAVGTAEAQARAQLDAFAEATSALIERARSDYEEQSGAYAASSQTERDRLSKELQGLADRTAELRADLSPAWPRPSSFFTRSHEAFAADLERKRREAEAEAEVSMREYKDAVQDLGAKLDTQRSQAFARIEAEAGRLGQAVAEIDRQQKAFVAQTKVFERADELKERLASATRRDESAVN